MRRRGGEIADEDDPRRYLLLSLNRWTDLLVLGDLDVRPTFAVTIHIYDYFCQ